MTISNYKSEATSTYSETAPLIIYQFLLTVICSKQSNLETYLVFIRITVNE